jgi:hypothetical protein
MVISVLCELRVFNPDKFYKILENLKTAETSVDNLYQQLVETQTISLNPIMRSKENDTKNKISRSSTPPNMQFNVEDIFLKCDV